jgi:hypothetical protein
MNVTPRNSSTYPETLKAKKAHYSALLKLAQNQSGKSTKLEKLTVNLLKAEIVLINDQLK